MKCGKCNAEMKPVQFVADMYASAPVVQFKRPGAFGSVVKSAVDCHVCPCCGQIEFCAKTPEVFKNS